MRTPIAGVVTQRNVNEGSLVVARRRRDGRRTRTTSSRTWRTCSPTPTWTRATSSRSKEGQTACVRVNALGDEVRLAGKVYDIANRAQQKANEDTKSFRVRIHDPRTRTTRLRPDMSANVDVETRVTDGRRAPRPAPVGPPAREEGRSRSGEASPQAPAARRAVRATSRPSVASLQRGPARRRLRARRGRTRSAAASSRSGPRTASSSRCVSGLEPKDWVVTRALPDARRAEGGRRRSSPTTRSRPRPTRRRATPRRARAASTSLGLARVDKP